MGSYRFFLHFWKLYQSQLYWAMPVYLRVWVIPKYIKMASPCAGLYIKTYSRNFSKFEEMIEIHYVIRESSWFKVMTICIVSITACKSNGGFSSMQRNFCNDWYAWLHRSACSMKRLRMGLTWIRCYPNG